jgi:exodeoxyribonuclease V alpha subunit
VAWYGLSDGEDVGEAIEKVAIDLGGFDSITHALQIIAPLNDRGSGSVLQLNRRFHALQLAKRNLDPDRCAVKGHLGQYFAAGDPITYLRNDYCRGLWNGSLGRIVSVDTHSRNVVGVFGGKEHRFDSAELINLGLAYSVTCHRAQGSSARRVIIPIIESRLLDPSWIYTAVTRAEEQAVLVGRPHTLDAALHRLPAWRRRITGCNFAAVANAEMARANAA